MMNDEIYMFDSSMAEEAVMMLAGILLVIGLVVLLFTVVGYIFQSLGLYTIAKRRGIQHPWLAWIPWVAPYWIAGSVSDQYHYVTHGEVKNRRIIVLVLVIVSMVLSGISSASIGSQWIETLEYIAEENANGADYDYYATARLGILDLVAGAVSIALFVFWHMSLFDLYNSCDPRYSTVFLVLGIIFGFLTPFFIFACRKKDFGMPPRREEPQYQYQPNPEPRTYQDPWDNA